MRAQTVDLTEVEIAQLNERVSTGPSAFAAAEIRLEEFIDLDEYPLHDMTSPKRQDLVQHCRAELVEHGCSHVPDFILPSAVAAMRDEALRLLPNAIYADDNNNPYFTPDDPSLPTDHPVRFFQKRTSAYINSDLLEPYSTLRKIYDSDVVLHFICECINAGPIYRWADPLGRNPYSVMQDGDYFPWHFDGNDFTVSILVQESDEGGVFEYRPYVRSPENENYAEVKAVLHGAREGVRELPLKNGDLQLFRGRHSMHRVTETKGDTARIIALPTYHTNPYLMNRPHHAKTLYGRYLPIHAERDMARTDHLTD
ncbi:MAG: hypothetical protein HKN50_12420 [Gammaproteobacteria bacterium]|nr:hypothetical protein [Gammaproteobacteria bacterium]